MSAEKRLEFFVYTHTEQEFNLFQGDHDKISQILGKPAEEVGQFLSIEKIDALLVLDDKDGRWYLAYSDKLGIVGQRTARRQADTIARSGYQMPAGYRIKGNYPMDELTDTNLGSLWQSVQQKYVKSDLKGMAIDPKTGLPYQLAERAERLSGTGLEDELAEAKYEKQEAEQRAKAIAKSGGNVRTLDEILGKKPAESKESKPKKVEAKKVEIKEIEPEKKVEPPTVDKQSKKKTPSRKVKKTKASKKTTKTAPKTPVKKSKTKKKTRKSTIKKKAPSKKSATKQTASKGFFEISNVKENVINGSTQIVAKGNLTYDGEPIDKTIIFDQVHLTQKEWTQIGLFLKPKDIVEISLVNDDGIDFAGSLKI